MTARPTPDHLLAIYQRLIEEDPVAPAEFTEIVLPSLVDELHRSRKDVRDQHMPCEAAIDAVLDFVRLPQRYDSSRSGIWGFLLMAGRRNLSNLLLKERRQQQRKNQLATVALRDSARKKGKDDVLTTLAKGEASAELREKFDRIVAACSVAEAAVLQLMLDGVRATAEYARVLRVDDRPSADQKRCVKQVKDRLFKRLKRALKEESDE